MSRHDQRAMRRAFVQGLWGSLRVIWPILSGLLIVIAALGLVAGLLEDWSISESLYFAFVSGLTIGYGDFAPKTVAGRGLAIAIGGCGILLTGMVAAVAVEALSEVRRSVRR